MATKRVKHPSVSESSTDAVAVETVEKYASVVVLPCQRGLPRGHILVVTVHGDTMAGAKEIPLDNEQDLNAKYAQILRWSIEEGYKLETLFAGRVHYRTTLRAFGRDPLAAVEFCRNYTPRQQEQVTGDLPF